MEILTKNFSQLFPGDKTAINAEFRRLSKIWHPDLCSDPKANDVFEHLTKMRDKALVGGMFEIFERANGSSFKMVYLRKHVGQGITVYVGNTRIAYLVTDATLLGRAKKYRPKYASPKMKDEMERFMPVFAREEILTTGSLMIYERKPSQILMRDLIDAEKTIKPVDATWMISRMCNLACYLEWAKHSHCAISPEFLLVDLDDHGVYFTGPNLYWTGFDSRPRPWPLPLRTVEAAPWLRNKNETADQRIDLQLVRETAYELLGDRGGARLLSRPDMRKELAQWLLSPAPKNAVLDYAAMEKTRGERKFARYGKTAQEIYAFLA